MRTDRPGYQYRRNADGATVHYWNPKRAVKAAPSFLSAIRLADELTDEEVAAECRRLTEELRRDLDKRDLPPAYDGTIKSLLACYRADPTATLRTVKHSTRVRDYEPSMRVLEAAVGDRRIDLLRGSDFTRWFDNWRKKGHRRAAGAIKLLRVVLTYGAGERLTGCAQARDILAHMRFEQPAPRRSAMTHEQCLAIVRASAAMGCPSIGFVEAIKFETALRRIDVIGEWSPADDGGPFRWRGLTAGDISRDLILKVKTSKTGAEVARDLRVMPLVQEALKAYSLPEIGPVVIDENTGKPYRDNHYNKKFRKVRDKAGVPADVWSMDTRAGAVSETFEATGSLEAARDLATHTTTKTTRRYNRGDGLESSRKVSEARNKNRK